MVRRRGVHKQAHLCVRVSELDGQRPFRHHGTLCSELPSLHHVDHGTGWPVDGDLQVQGGENDTSNTQQQRLLTSFKMATVNCRSPLTLFTIVAVIVYTCESPHTHTHTHSEGKKKTNSEERERGRFTHIHRCDVFLSLSCRLHREV